MNGLDIFDLPGLEDGVTPTEPIEEEDVPGLSNPENIFIFSEDENCKKPLPMVPIKVVVKEKGLLYIVDLFGAIYTDRYYRELISLLETSSKDTTFVIRISSPGGDIAVGTIIASAIMNSKATVIGVAVGAIASAATFLWSCCHKQAVMDGAVMLFHMSSHGDYGVSTQIQERASSLINYVKEYLLGISLRKGHLLEEEYDTIINQSKDIIVGTKAMRDRLESNPNYIQDIKAVL